MTDQQHPITPPIKLVDQWADKYQGHMPEWILRHVAAEAAQWGADQELEACCAEVSYWASEGVEKEMRAARRPKPPSLKEQALLAIDTAVADGRLSPEVSYIVRCALDQLDG